MWNRRKKVLVLLFGALLIAAAATGIYSYMSQKRLTKKEQAEPEPLVEEEPEAPAEEEKPYRSAMQHDKEETVYIKAAPDGTAREVTVEAALKNPGDGAPIPDRTNLKEIKNTKGTEEYTLSSDGQLTWENQGEDIRYKGVSEEELPIQVRISYFLNGQKIGPEELAGKSGRVTIRFDYENVSSGTADVAGNEIEVPVPFMVYSAVFLSSDIFSDVEVTNGKLIAMDDQMLALGTAYPGLADCLKLADYEPAKEVEIPEYVEISAYAENFELDFTATIFTTGLFGELEDDDLDEIDQMIDDMEELKEGTQDLREGTSDLYDGVEELKDGMEEYLDGVDEAADAVGELTEALEQLHEQKEELRDGAETLQQGLEEVDAALAQVTFPSQGAESGDGVNLEEEAAALQADIQTLSEAILSMEAELQAEAEAVGEEIDPESAKMRILTQMKTSLENLTGRLATIQTALLSMSQAAETLPTLAASVETLKTGIRQLAEGSGLLSEGVHLYTHYVSEVYRAMLKLNDGVQEVKDARPELDDGLTELLDGAGELRDGVGEFCDDGVDELTDLAGEDLQYIVDHAKALKEVEKQYMSFGGIPEGKSGSVTFLMETDAIEE